MAGTQATVSWIAAADEAVGLAKNADEAQRQVAVLDEARGDLARLLTEFVALADGVAVVRSFGWDGKFPSPDLVSDLSEAGASLDPRPLNRVVKSLERFRGDLSVAVTERWKEHAADQLGDVGDLRSLAQTLSEVEGIAKLSKQLDADLGELARTQNSLPSAKSAELLKRAKKSLHQLEESLRPDDVRRFLSAVARGGASIDLLSSDVTQWLVTHNALARFSIVARPPAADTDV